MQRKSGIKVSGEMLRVLKDMEEIRNPMNTPSDLGTTLRTFQALEKRGFIEKHGSLTAKLTPKGLHLLSNPNIIEDWNGWQRL